jgi:hypothetical protein
MFAGIDAYDLVFVLTAIAFNLLIVGIFVAQKNGWAKPVKIIGILWLLLTIPLAVVFVRYLTEGKGPGIMVLFGLVFSTSLLSFSWITSSGSISGGSGSRTLPISYWNMPLCSV